MPEEKSDTPQPLSPQAVDELIKALTERVNRPKDVHAAYANGTVYEVSPSDLKIFFGQSDQRQNKTDWHTAITIPWIQAKILSYFIQANIAFYEKTFGTIHVPQHLIPEVPDPTEEQLKSDPAAVELREGYKSIRDAVFGTH